MNCLRTLPYVRGWYERYVDLGLQIIGVHTPEFPFARSKAQLQAAVGRLGIRWPVVMDNDRAIWSAFANPAWPTLYLIDARGYVRYRHAGEGRYGETERAIQTLLREISPETSFPDPMSLVRPEDADGAACHPSTAELHVGAFGGALPPDTSSQVFSVPEVRSDGHFYVEGSWRTVEEGLTLVSERGRIVLSYHAASVNAVLSPTPRPDRESAVLDPPMTVELLLDGQPLPRRCFGEDVFLAAGKAVARIDAARMFALVRADDATSHELELQVRQIGLTFYAFSFGSCLISASSQNHHTKE